MKTLRRELMRLPELLRWRHPFYVLLLGLRELFRPLFYWYVFDIFVTDLRTRIPESYSKDVVAVRIYSGIADLQKAREDLNGLDGLAAADIDLRLRRGDVVAVGYVEDRVAGAMWMTFATGMEVVFGTAWIVAPGEALRYDSFVCPDCRGKAIHSILNRKLNEYARERGILRTLASISVLNRQSINLAKHLKRTRAMRILLFRLRGMNWTYRRAFGAPMESRFDLAPRFQTRLATSK